MNIESFSALCSIQEQIKPIKKELRALTRDIKEAFRNRNAAESALYLVVNAVNNGRSPKEIKKIAVRGLRACKEKVYV